MKLVEVIIPSNLNISSEIPEPTPLSENLIKGRRPTPRRVIFTSSIALSEFLAACAGTSPKPSGTPSPLASGAISVGGEMDTTGGGLETATPEKMAQRVNLVSHYIGKRKDAEDMGAPANCVDVLWMALDAYGYDRNLFRPSDTAQIIYNSVKDKDEVKALVDFKPPNTKLEEGDIVFYKGPPFGKYIDTNDKTTKYAGHVGIAMGTKDKNGVDQILDQNYTNIKGTDGNYYSSPINIDSIPSDNILGILRPKVLGKPVQGAYQTLPLPPGYTPGPTPEPVGNVTGPGTTAYPYPETTLSPEALKKEMDKVQWNEYASVYPHPNFGYQTPVGWKAHPKDWDSTESQSNGEVKKISQYQ